MESKEGVVMKNENARIELDFSVGKQGNDGKSAYQIAVDNGFEGSEAEWLKSFMRVNPNLINTTTEEIISLRDTNKLIPSQTYHITDYISHYDEFEIESAKHPYDLIVTANSLNSFFEDAKAVLHEGDEYFANNDLSKWQLKIDNNLKVLWMKDEFNNEAPYDFKNVLFPVRYGDEMLSLYTFSIEGEDYSLNPTAEYLVGTEIEIPYSIGMCENNVIKGCTIPEGFQGTCVISQSTYAINNEILTGIENNRITLDKETNFVVLNSWGTSSNNNVNIDNGSYVYIPQVREFNENVIKGLVTIDCASYTLEQHYDLLGTFSSNVITNSKVKNKGSYNFYENSVCETEYHNLNIQLDNCKIVSCTWKLNVSIEIADQVHLFDKLTAVNSDFILDYVSEPNMLKTGEVLKLGEGLYNVTNSERVVSYEKFDDLGKNGQLFPGQQIFLDKKPESKPYWWNGEKWISWKDVNMDSSTFWQTDKANAEVSTSVKIERGFDTESCSIWDLVTSAGLNFDVGRNYEIAVGPDPAGNVAILREHLFDGFYNFRKNNLTNIRYQFLLKQIFTRSHIIEVTNKPVTVRIPRVFRYDYDNISSINPPYVFVNNALLRGDYYEFSFTDSCRIDFICTYYGYYFSVYSDDDIALSTRENSTLVSFLNENNVEKSTLFNKFSLHSLLVAVINKLNQLEQTE
jgi:hypothetical protein